MKVSLHLRIVLDLLDEVVHGKLTVERQCYVADFVGLKTRLFTFKQLTDELAVHVLVCIQIELTKITVSSRSNLILTTE